MPLCLNMRDVPQNAFVHHLFDCLVEDAVPALESDLQNLLRVLPAKARSACTSSGRKTMLFSQKVCLPA